MSQIKSSKIKFKLSASKLFLIFSIAVSIILLCLILWKVNIFSQNVPTDDLASQNLENIYTADTSESVNFAGSNKSITNDLQEIVVLFSITLTILFILAVYFFGKAVRDSLVIEKSQKNLEIEKYARKKTEVRLSQTHNELLTQSNQFNEILEGTTDLIAAIDKDFNLLFFNESFRKDFRKIFLEDIKKGDNIIESLSPIPEQAKFAKKLWQRALNGEKFSAEQSYNDDFDGTIYYEVTYNPIINESGTVIGATQIARDITQRQIAASETENERNFVAAVVDVSSSLVIVLNREGRIIKFNKACENLTGFTFEEVHNKVIWDILIPTADVKTIRQGFRKIDSGNFDGDYVNHLITKDEKLKLISWKVSSIKDEHRQIQYVVSTGIDITEKEEFETSRNRMLDILENSKDFIGLINLGGSLKYLNIAGRNLLGLTSASDISRLNLIGCLTEESSKLLLEKGLPQTSKKDSWTGEVYLKNKGKEIPLSLLLLSHKNKSGKIEFISVVARDITDVKQMEDQLNQTKGLSDRSMPSKSDFLANMSHEIRTPLNGVVGMIDLLLNSRLDEQQKDIVKTIKTSGEILLTTINAILDLSKIEAGKLRIELVEFDLRNLIEEVINLFSQNITNKNLDLLMAVYNEVPQKVLGDPGRLRQILINLVGNALKFTEEGEVIVRVRVENKSKNQVKLKFSVKDSGIGIEKNAQENLFNAFVQADETISGKYGGTGLGLSISKNLVQLMNGEIGLESEPGNGSEFWFSVEFEIAGEDKTIHAANNFPTNSKILIVDKNKSARHILLYHSKAIGVFAEEAEKPSDALELLTKSARNGEPFRYVLIDKQLFDTDGIILIEKIKKSGLLKNTKFALMLGKNDLTVIENAKNAGIETVIYKPILQTVFQNTLKNLLGTDNETQENVAEPNLILRTEVGNKEDIKTRKTSVILVAEDNPINQKVIFSQISALGYQVEMVSDGKEVLKALKLKKYDLILMDCQMPVLTGLATTEKIRKTDDEHLKQLPIIAVTAQVISGDREKCLAAGMNDYINKPTSQQQLQEVLDFWLNRSNSKAFSPNESFQPDVYEEKRIYSSESEAIGNRLDELSEFSDNEVVIECIELFLNDSVNVLKNIEKAGKNSDHERILRETHKLKGSAANMGALKLPELCQILITELREENFVNTTELINKISEEYNLIQPFYKTELQKFKSKQNKPSLVG